MTVLGLESATRFGTEGGVIRGLESWGAAGGGFSPTDIANLVGVWRADVAADFTLAGSNFTEWRPNLGSGTPFTVRSGTPIRDTTPAPEVVLGQSSMALHSPLALTQPFTVAYVLRLDNGWGNPVMEGPADETNVFRHGSNGNFTAECAGSEIGVVMDNTAFHVVTIVFNGASSVIRCDGTEVTGTLGTSNFGAYVYFGSATGGVANGNQEHRGFVAYGKALTLTEREDLEVWLTAELLPAPPSITEVQSVTNHSGSANYTLVLPSNVTVGNYIIVTGATYQDNFLQPTDSRGHTYTQAGTQGNANSVSYVGTWFTKVTSAGPCTITTNVGQGAAAASEFSGLAASAVLHDSDNTTGTGTALTAAATGTLPQANCLIIGHCSSNFPQMLTWTTDATFLLLGEERDNLTYQAFNAQYKITSSTADVTPTWVCSHSEQWVAQRHVFLGAT